MDDREARRRDLQNQIYQLDMEARASALTPLEAELRGLGEPGPGAGENGGAAAGR